ncbi:MAG: hypothetical protein ACFN3H_01190 [Spirochaetales bacterium]
MKYCYSMTDSDLLAYLEKKHGEKITWHAKASFYADTEGNIFEDGVLLYLTDVTFRCYAEGFNSSFEAIDVLYYDYTTKKNVIDFINGDQKRLKRINPIHAFFVDSISSLEFENHKMKFFKVKGGDFKQLLNIARAKQKYSLTVAKRNESI